VTPPPRGAALFDIDETLITIKSMFRFLAYALAAQNRSAEYDPVERDLRVMAAAGVSREVGCRRFYRALTGMDRDLLAELGREWFDVERARGGLFHASTLEALQAHRRAGDLIVLVSGSFPACLDPLAHHVNADVLLCTRPRFDRSGRYSGEVDRPMIGETKAAAVRNSAALYGLDLSRTVAYGDHVSDVPLLELAGSAAVLDHDGSLAGHARARGWRVLESSQSRAAAAGAAAAAAGHAGP
jgi:HAD superfamily hydrolase (TIGR01490 family)